MADHIPTRELREQIKHLAATGIPIHLIVKIVRMDDDTLRKYYHRELELGKAEAVAAVGSTVIEQALAGDPKAQALYLKTQGSKFGWVEKQVIEQKTDSEIKELRETIARLEEQAQRDY